MCDRQTREVTHHKRRDSSQLSSASFLYLARFPSPITYHCLQPHPHLSRKNPHFLLCICSLSAQSMGNTVFFLSGGCAAPGPREGSPAAAPGLTAVLTRLW